MGPYGLSDEILRTGLAAICATTKELTSRVDR
jgi:hypothetical protein